MMSVLKASCREERNSGKSKLKNITILGGGLAGLAAAWGVNEKNCAIFVVEKNKEIGGLAKTLVFDEFSADIGPHRFISNNAQLIEKVKALPRINFSSVTRVSRFFVQGKFFDYPVNIKNIFLNIKFRQVVMILLDYFKERMKSVFKRNKHETLEKYIISNFGKSLANMNMLNYSEKIWGMPSREISSKWANERIRGLSVGEVIKVLFYRSVKQKTLSSDFLYPESGIGSICETIVKNLKKNDNFKLITQSYPKRILHENGKIIKIELFDNNDKVLEVFPDTVVSSISITELIKLFEPALPQAVLQAASFLKYRSHVCLFIALDKSSVFYDHWVYFPEKEIPFSRISEPKNFSKRMSPSEKTSLMIEFFCWEGDELWMADKEKLLAKSLSWLEKANFVKKEEIIKSFVHREKDAYPVYDIGFEKNLKLIKNCLTQFDNLFLCGRRGSFKYNNMDEALEDGLDISEKLDKTFNQNTDRVV